MSNVRIEATGEVGLRIAVNLGPNERKVHICEPSHGIDLTVGGNQTLAISEDSAAESVDEGIPMAVGADISELPEAEPESEVNPIAAEVHDYDGDSPLEQGQWPGNPFDEDDDEPASV